MLHSCLIPTLISILVAVPAGAEPDSAAAKRSQTAADASPAPESVSPEVAAKAVAATPLVLLLRDDRVRSELKLDAAQTAAVDAALTDVQSQLWSVRDRKDAEFDAGRGRVYDHLRQALAGACQPAQIERLDGLLLNLVSWRGIRLEQFQSKINLSSDQLTRMNRLLDEFGSSAPLTADQLESLQALLSPEQQRTVGRILGDRFDLSALRTRYCPAPEFADISTWINTEPLDFEKLRGKVVVVHFWAFGCINCIRNIPHYQAWFQQYQNRDVVIVGIHTPETATERDIDAVRVKVAENKMQYPVAIDGKGATWNAWANAWWPSVYLVDKRGYVRHWWYGELNWQDAKGEESMRGRIESLLAEE